MSEVKRCKTAPSSGRDEQIERLKLDVELKASIARIAIINFETAENRVADLEAERDALRAENERLRKAVEGMLRSLTGDRPGEAARIGRAALAESTEAADV